MIALIHLRPRVIIEVYRTVPNFIGHPVKPKSRLVSPAVVGWQGGGDITYQDDGKGGKVAVEGPPKYAVVDVTPAPAIPAGKRRKGGSAYDFNQAGEVVETITLEDIPPPGPGPRDLEAEIDDLKTRMAVQESR